jgi:uncharacterized repeat protein (TIGR03803 family)
MFRIYSAIGLCALAIVLPLNVASAKGVKDIVLYDFKGGADGWYPFAGLIADGAGNLYGTTKFGGTGTCDNGCGTVFKLAPNGTETVLYSFKGGTDGAEPEAGLITDSAGNFYSTTFAGGAEGLGTVFKLTPAGEETVLYSFKGGTDGSNPQAVLLADSAGNLYGTTEQGGKRKDGTVFKLAPNGTETVLYSFKGGLNDGAYPLAGVIADGAGNLYGTTSGIKRGEQTAFKLAPNGKETVLHVFPRNNKDGDHPLAGLIADNAGNLYGTTEYGVKTGECPGGCGTVFKITPTGKETVIYAFNGKKDGSHPVAGMIADGAGNLYGTTYEGGNGDWGTVFKLAPNGTLTVLYSFPLGGNGENPEGGLIADSAGNLFGTTIGGGFNDQGIVFEIPAEKKK